MPLADLLRLADIALTGQANPQLSEDLLRAVVEETGSRAGVLRRAGDVVARWPRTVSSQVEDATEGWTEVSKKDSLTLAKEAVSLGVKRFIYTDISRDGMMTGPNFEGIKEFVGSIDAAVIASGGISSQEDIEKLKATGVEGCILGKALYEGKIKLEEILD